MFLSIKTEYHLRYEKQKRAAQQGAHSQSHHEGQNHFVGLELHEGKEDYPKKRTKIDQRHEEKPETPSCKKKTSYFTVPSYFTAQWEHALSVFVG